MELEAGAVVAQRYRVLRQLGRGGMGEVFAAENIRTGRTVAVKVLRADSKQKSSAVERFRREARAAGAISSDYVTQVLDVEDDPEHGIIIVFEILEGESLIDRLKRTGPMTFDELFPVVEQVWMGLVDAHKSGVIHRDLKPSNVFLERRPDGSARVKILDFGISKLPREVGGETLTEMGQSLGTFSFMPPEQIGKAKTVDHRADIYACATLIYQAMSGQLPYGAKNILQMVDLKTKSEPRPLASVLDGPVDPRLESFLSKGLARDPANRFQSAAEALDVWRGLKSSVAPPPVAQPAVPQHAPQHQHQHQQPQQQQHHQQQHAPPQQHQQQRAASQSGQHGAVSVQASSMPVYQGAASQAPSSPQQPPQGRAPATVMLSDPRSLAVSPYPQGGHPQTPGPQNHQQQSQQQQQQAQSRFGGTVAMQNAPSRGPAIDVPVVNDTSSEGVGDHIATIAMPMRNVAAVLAGAASQKQQAGGGVPRMHDDPSGQGQMGTQLMSHASLRQQGVPMPQQQRASSSQLPRMQPQPQQQPQQQQQQPPQLTPVPSGQYQQNNQSSSGSGPHNLSNQAALAVAQANNAAQGEGADLTTVYRREKPGTTGPQPMLRGGGRSIGMILGVIAFALVGFAIAAIVLRYVQTGYFPWQTPAP